MKQRFALIIAIAMILAAAGMFIYQNKNTTDKKTITNNLKQVEDTESKEETKKEKEEGKNLQKRKTRVTSGTKHNVPLKEIVDGKPPKDGIPSIDNPKFVPAEQASLINSNTQGIAISIKNTHRFYPYNILAWHEIVNDKINGKRILVTYCPLCQSGAVYDPKVKGERVEFGTSGKLWQSNLVMYDRKTDSHWSQVLGEAIKGEMTGTKLDKMPSDITKFGNWKNKYPQGEVLSTDTGYSRNYQYTPYADYHKNEGTYFPTKSDDDRLGKKESILGLKIDGQTKAYYSPTIKEKRQIKDSFARKMIVAKHDKKLNLTKIFKKTNSGFEPVPTVASYWFCWSAAHPNTKLYK